jgi:hypothetical protein
MFHLKGFAIRIELDLREFNSLSRAKLLVDARACGQALAFNELDFLNRAIT